MEHPTTGCRRRGPRRILGMTAVTIQTVGLVAVPIVVALGAIAGIVLWLVFALRSRRRERRRQEEARRAWEERLSPLGASGILGLAAGLEGVRLASPAIGVGSDLARQGFAPVGAGALPGGGQPASVSELLPTIRGGPRQVGSRWWQNCDHRTTDRTGGAPLVPTDLQLILEDRAEPPAGAGGG